MNRRTFFRTTVGALLAGFLPRPKSPLFRSSNAYYRSGYWNPNIHQKKFMARIRITPEAMIGIPSGEYSRAHAALMQSIVRDINAREEWSILGSAK